MMISYSEIIILVWVFFMFKGETMVITKIMNNNLIFSKNYKGEDIIIAGLGIGFQKKSGDQIDEKKIERIFILEKDINKDKMTKLFQDIPIDYLYVADQIVELGEKKLGKKLSRNIYLTLSDHIYYASERIKKGMIFSNELLWEIKRFYPDEYKFSIECVDIINEKLKINFPIEEASFLALHIVNAEIGGQAVQEAISMTKLIQDILNIIKYEFAIKIDEDSLDYTRLVLHLKFFAQRLLKNQVDKADAGFLYKQVQENMARAFTCTKKIENYLRKIYSYNLSENEKVFLTIHIDRVTKNIR